MRYRACSILFLIAATGAFAQQVGQNKTTEDAQGYTLSIRSQLVVEAVTVKDKQGNFVRGLSAKDFVLTEDGAPQTVRFCEHEDLANHSERLQRLSGSDGIATYKHLNRAQIAPEIVGNERYKNRRLLALYFDMTAMAQDEQFRALAAADQFIRTQMSTSDLIAILRYNGGSVDVLQDFSDNRERLLSIIETLATGESEDLGAVDEGVGSADDSGEFGQDDGEFSVFKTDRQLSALQTAVKMLGHVNEKKSLIYFASGLHLNGVDNQAQFHATVDTALRGGVSFWPIDARGLIAFPPLGDATQASPGGMSIYTGAAVQTTLAGFQRSQDSLFALAGDTGGKAFLDSNDLTRGIEQAQQAIEDYYILGYYTTNSALDGKFRRVKISLTSNSDAKLDYRQGYYADKEFVRFNVADKERQLEDALMLEDPITELTIAMEIDYFQLNRAEYFVPIVVKIPGRELALAKRKGADHTQIDFIGEIKDVVGGTTVTNARDNIDIKLPEETAAQLAKRPIEYDTGFTLLPGRYKIKFLARDNETGRIGTYETTFIIPNLNREEKNVPISAVILSAERKDAKDVIYDAVKAKDREKADAVDPLVQDGKKLVPSATRVFSRARALHVYLQGYQQDVSEPQPMVAYATFYRRDEKVFETQPITGLPVAGNRLGLVPLSFDVSLESLSPGEYDCQVTVVNPSGKKVAFWRSPILLVP